ncbi:hypothetical protein [Streptomyces sp. NBC_01233]|uniref:hypothetical protein n=1 Tax=Streptomyces sp. NBC_01233 TaxID=2903787 RepID=UPI002E13FD19|nr:hypothetical protein OG332_26210 [Streptomyces sp. NBC_01233]
MPFLSVTSRAALLLLSLHVERRRNLIVEPGKTYEWYRSRRAISRILVRTL